MQSSTGAVVRQPDLGEIKEKEGADVRQRRR